jgi:hypothetical protein
MDVLKRTDAQDLADYKQAAEVLRDEVKRLCAALKNIETTEVLTTVEQIKAYAKTVNS